MQICIIWKAAHVEQAILQWHISQKYTAHLAVVVNQISQ